MFLNIVLGFFLPWIFGIILHYKDKKIMPIIVPFMVIWAYLLNELCFHLDLYRLVPVNIDDDYTTISVNLGLYPILGSYLIYFIKTKKVSPYILILKFAVFTTLLEYLGVLTGLVTYNNGWNLAWTLLSYIPPYTTSYWYYRALRKANIIND